MKRGIRGHDVRAAGVVAIARKMAERGIEYIQLVMERSVEGFAQGSFTEDYAKSIGASFYGKTAMDSVRYAESLFKK